MNIRTEDLGLPMNANERYLYSLNKRLDIIIEQNNSIIDYLSKKDNVAVQETKNETITAVDLKDIPEIETYKVEAKPKVTRTRKKVE